MFDGKEYAQLYLKNGFELVLTMDAAEFDESIVFKGKGAKENNFLVKSAVDSQSYDYDTLLASDEEVFEKLMAERKKNVINAIDNANLDAVFVTKYKELKSEIAKVIIGQDDVDKVLSNIVNIALDSCKQHGAATFISGLFHKWFK